LSANAGFGRKPLSETELATWKEQREIHTMTLAILNNELFTKETETQRQELGAALPESFNNYGFVKPVNHACEAF
jgi:hypothetical protein